jgi:hypothetical protein
MNDIFIARRAEIEKEAEKLGTTPIKLVDELAELIDRHGTNLPHTMRAIPKTMRSQFGPQPGA